jgi:hypothetical protein
MTITYAKVINSLYCYSQIEGESDVVFTINWNMTGIEENFFSSVMCITSVPYAAGQQFIPYADLTEEQVLSWINEYTTPEDMASYERSIFDNIEQQKVVVTPPLPWISPLP